MERIIVMLHLDYRIMPIVALQRHVILSMVMGDAVHPSLSVEKVREIVIRIVTARMVSNVEQTIVQVVSLMDLIVVLQLMMPQPTFLTVLLQPRLFPQQFYKVK